MENLNMSNSSNINQNRENLNISNINNNQNRENHKKEILHALDNYETGSYFRLTDGYCTFDPPLEFKSFRSVSYKESGFIPECRLRKRFDCYFDGYVPDAVFLWKVVMRVKDDRKGMNDPKFYFIENLEYSSFSCWDGIPV
jgi:hypothetical protein